LRQLAALCNMNPSSLSKMESGLQCPNRDTLIKLAKHLQTSTDYLCGIKDDSTPYSMHISLGMNYNIPSSSVQKAIDNYCLTDNNVFDFFQQELINVFAHVENLKKTGKYDPVGDVEIVRSLSKIKGDSEAENIGKSQLTKDYEELVNEIFALCNTGTGNHSENVRSVLSFLKANANRIKIK